MTKKLTYEDLEQRIQELEGFAQNSEVSYREIFDLATDMIIIQDINTGEITSDIINSLSHLTKKYTNIDNLNITENVFKNLNPRMKNYFIKVNNKAKSKLYQYQFFNYPSESPINNK